MDERLKKAFDFAADATKQLLTLATGIIALTITFVKDLLHGGVPPGYRWLLIASWVIYVLSIGFGVMTLLALTGTLEPKQSPPPPASIRGRNVTVPSMFQICTFVIATVLLVIFASCTTPKSSS